MPRETKNIRLHTRPVELMSIFQNTSLSYRLYILLRCNVIPYFLKFPRKWNTNVAGGCAKNRERDLWILGTVLFTFVIINRDHSPPPKPWKPLSFYATLYFISNYVVTHWLAGILIKRHNSSSKPHINVSLFVILLHVPNNRL